MFTWPQVGVGCCLWSHDCEGSTWEKFSPHFYLLGAYSLSLMPNWIATTETCLRFLPVKMYPSILWILLLPIYNINHIWPHLSYLWTPFSYLALKTPWQIYFHFIFDYCILSYHLVHCIYPTYLMIETALSSYFKWSQLVWILYELFTWTRNNMHIINHNV